MAQKTTSKEHPRWNILRFQNADSYGDVLILC